MTGILPDDVSSPGQVTAARAAFERQVDRVTQRAVGRFLRAVYQDATEAWASPVVLAAAEPFTLAQVAARWEPVAEDVAANLARAAGAAADSRFLGAVLQRLRDARLPLAAYEEVKGVLTAAMADPNNLPNRNQLRAALRAGLLPGGRPSESHWADQARRIARTETTAVFNHLVEGRLAGEARESKRWITRHDRKVRPTHSAADGQTVPVGEPFHVGGWPMMYPGDPAAPASETASCRCVIAAAKAPAPAVPAAPTTPGLAAEDTLAEVSPDRFHAAFTSAFEGSPYNHHVTIYSEDELAGMKTLLTPDGKAGVAIHDHGDGRIEGTALFNQSGRTGVGTSLLTQGVERYDVNYVECFGPYLNKLYEKVGFRVTDTFPFDPKEAPVGWDYARFDNPEYHLLRWAGRAVTSAADSTRSGAALTPADAARLWEATVREVEDAATPEQAQYLAEQKAAAETQV